MGEVRQMRFGHGHSRPRNVQITLLDGQVGLELARVDLEQRLPFLHGFAGGHEDFRDYSRERRANGDVFGARLHEPYRRHAI
jgi:hypothetical protein